MLIGMVVLVVLVLIGLSVAAPVVARDLRRQKELESQHRAEQYVRAIRLYYRKNKAYPPSLDALKQTNNIRYLRQEYVDPLTGKSDWRILHLGEQKTTVKGFFGKELGGISSGGLGSASSLASGGTTTPLNSSFSQSSSTTSGAAGSTGATGSTGSTFGSSTFGSGTFGSTGASGSSGGLGGGGAIIGVGTARTGESVTQPNQQTTYEKWEFWYDPRIEQMYQKGAQNAGLGGTAAGSLGSASSLSGATGSTGSPFGSSPFGSSGATGTTGATGSTGSATQP